MQLTAVPTSWEPAARTNPAVIPKAATTPQPARLRHAASEFESLLIAGMLRSARESAAAEADDSDEGDSNSPVMELGEQQFAQALADSGGLGLAKIVVVGLSENANR